MKNNNEIFVSTGKSRNTYMLKQEDYTKVIKRKRHQNLQEINS